MRLVMYFAFNKDQVIQAALKAKTKTPKPVRYS